jgi:hypothetical protein
MFWESASSPWPEQLRPTHSVDHEVLSNGWLCLFLWLTQEHYLEELHLSVGLSLNQTLEV